MKDDAERLADYLQDRVGESLRGVGYHTPDTHDVAYIREDVASVYPTERLERFIDVLRSVGTTLNRLDEMGRPHASMHRLDEGLIIQFYRGNDQVIYVALDADVGRNFTRFIDDCQNVME